MTGAERLLAGYGCVGHAGVSLANPLQSVEEKGYPVLNWQDARTRRADEGKYKEVKCLRSHVLVKQEPTTPAAGARPAETGAAGAGAVSTPSSPHGVPACDEWAMPYYLEYRFDAIQKRVWGPPGYCNSCYNMAAEPALVDHRARMTVAAAALAKENRDQLYALVYSSGSTYGRRGEQQRPLSCTPPPTPHPAALPLTYRPTGCVLRVVCLSVVVQRVA
jgi:hypothetical protein